jgi:hypothetical protein
MQNIKGIHEKECKQVSILRKRTQLQSYSGSYSQGPPTICTAVRTFRWPAAMGGCVNISISGTMGEVKVKVTLRLTVNQSVTQSCCRAPSGAHDQIFITL